MEVEWFRRCPLVTVCSDCLEHDVTRTRWTPGRLLSEPQPDVFAPPTADAIREYGNVIVVKPFVEEDRGER